MKGSDAEGVALPAIAWRVRGGPEELPKPVPLTRQVARTLRPETLRPAREILALHGKNNRPGLAWFGATRQLLACESGFEMFVVHQLDFEGGTVAIASQPFALYLQLPDRPPGKATAHVPDFYLVRDDGTPVVIDAHHASNGHRTGSSAVFDATGEACDVVGWAYRLINDPDAHFQRNLTLVSGYRVAPPHVDQVLSAAMTALEAGPLAWTDLLRGISRVTELHPALVLPCLFHCIWTRHLAVPLHEQLTATTLVRAPRETDHE